MPLLTLNTLDQMLLGCVENNDVLYLLRERTAAINEAIKIINLHTGFLHTSADMPGWSVAGRTFYDVPAGVLIPLRMEFEGRYLHPIGLQAISQSYPDWMKENTANTGCAVSRWARAGLKRIAIHPADSIGGQDMLFYGVAEPTPLVNPTDTIPLNDELADEIKDYAAHILPFKEGGAIFAAASLYYQEFIRKRKKTTRWRQMQWPAYYVETKVAQ